MGRGNQLHATFRNGARRQRFRFGADFIDDDDLGHVIFHRLDHHGMLLGGRGHLHTPRPPNARVGNVTVASDLVRGIHDNDAFAHVICQQARRFAQQGGLSDPRAPEEEQGLPLFDNIAQNVHSAKQRPPDTTGETDDHAPAVPDSRNAVQGALDTGAVVLPEHADVRDNVVDIFT